MTDSPSTARAEELVRELAVSAVLNVCPGLEWVVILPVEGGASLVFESSSTGREIALSLPTDGDPLYFAARGPGPLGYRRAGIVQDDAAIAVLARWVSMDDAVLPSTGLDVAP